MMVGELHEVMLQVLKAGLPDSEPLPRSSIDAVLGAQGRQEGGTAQERAIRATARATCLAQAGMPREALMVADRQAMELLWRAAGSLPPSVQSAGYAVLTEIYLVNGRCSDGNECARIAEDYARESDDEASIFRSLGLRAATAAQNGELREAIDMMSTAAEIEAGRGWSATSWPIAWASIHIGYREADTRRVSAALEVLKLGAPDNHVARALHRLGVVIYHTTRNDFREVVAAADELIHGVCRDCSTPYLNDLAISMKACALVDLGEVHAAKKAIAGRHSAPGHPVCFELIRAGISLRTGEPRKALHETESCVDGTPHNLRTLPLVQVRRAIAYEKLGHTELADAKFSKAAHLAASLGSSRLATGIPPIELAVLFNRFIAREEVYSRAAPVTVEPVGGYAALAQDGRSPSRLTEREAVLADWLPTSLTLAQIAEQLRVSVNTVKTQARSVYKKMGARSREEAVTHLERTGFYVDRQPPRRS